MALIQKIRKRQGLLLAFVGLGMLGFLIPYDAVMSLFGSDAGDDVVCQIGESTTISRADFDREVGKREALGFANSDQDVWNDMIEGALLSDTYEALGIDIQEEEVQSMMDGTLYSDFMNRAFSYNPRTPQDTARSMNFKLMFDDLLEKEDPRFQGYVELLAEKRRQEIFDEIASRSLHVNSLEAKYDNLIQNSPSSFQYVVKRYDDIPDSEVEVSDADVSAYYEAHKSEYWQDFESRDLFYVEVPIIATEEDERAAYSLIEQRTNDWRAKGGALSAMDSRFDLIPTWQHSVAGPQSASLEFKSLNSNVASAMESALFVEPIGTVVGPYKVGNDYISSRVVTGFQPESVTSRNILIALQDTAMADSLVGMLRDGTPFDDLLTYSLDANATSTGGVIEIAERDSSDAYHDFCFTRPIGIIDRVETPEGWRVTQVIDQQGFTSANLAFIRGSIAASTSTKKAAYDKARALTKVSDKSKSGLTSEAQKLNLLYAEANNLTENSTLPGKLNTENVVSKAFELTSSVGRVMSPIQTPNAYYVILLMDIQRPGLPSQKNIEDDMRTGAINLKKGALYANQMAGASSMDALASSIGETVKNANQISWKSPASIEPQVACAALSTEIGAMSTPIIGKTGVWVILPRTLDQSQGDNALLQSSSTLELKRFMDVNRRVAPFKPSFWTWEMMKKAGVSDLRRVQ